MKKTVLIAVALALALVSAPCDAVELGTVGATYPIAEKDLMERFKEVIAGLDKDKLIKEIQEKGKKQILEYRPRDLLTLPAATKDDSFSVDMTWTLPFDIPDGKGGLIYPKGFTFNPLNHVYYTRTLVFIDASDKRQVDWLLASPFSKKLSARIMLTGGSYYDFIRKHRRHVFYAPRSVVERLRLRYVPAVAVQQGTKMVVYEYDPEKPRRAAGRKS